MLANDPRLVRVWPKQGLMIWFLELTVCKNCILYSITYNIGKHIWEIYFMPKLKTPRPVFDKKVIEILEAVF